MEELNLNSVVLYTVAYDKLQLKGCEALFACGHFRKEECAKSSFNLHQAFFQLLRINQREESSIYLGESN